jgi:hypothetical protein
MSLPRRAGSRAARFVTPTLKITPCSSWTDTQSIRKKKTTTAGNQVESHTQTLDPGSRLNSGSVIVGSPFTADFSVASFDSTGWMPLWFLGSPIRSSPLKGLVSLENTFHAKLCIAQKDAKYEYFHWLRQERATKDRKITICRWARRPKVLADWALIQRRLRSICVNPRESQFNIHHGNSD